MTAYELERFLTSAYRSMRESAREAQRRASAKELMTEVVRQLKTSDVAVVKSGDKEFTMTRDQVREALLQP
jgi:hypothetical protein